MEESKEDNILEELIAELHSILIVSVPLFLYIIQIVQTITTNESNIQILIPPYIIFTTVAILIIYHGAKNGREVLPEEQIHLMIVVIWMSSLVSVIVISILDHMFLTNILTTTSEIPTTEEYILNIRETGRHMIMLIFASSMTLTVSFKQQDYS